MNTNIFNSTSYEIVNLLIKNSNTQIHGREISRLLKSNQKTIQSHLNLLEKEDIVEKVKSGKNYLYKLSTNTKSFSFLSMTENYKAICLCSDFEISEIIKDIRVQTKKPIIVFGSYAKNYQTKKSDIDILVFEKIKSIQHKYAKEIHLMTMDELSFKNNQNDAFQTEIINNHIVIQYPEFILELWVKKYGQSGLVQKSE